MSEQQPYSESELVDLVRAIDVRAPERLHDQIQAMVDEHSTRRRSSSPWTRALGALPTFPTFSPRLGAATTLAAGGAAAVAAAAVVVLVLVLVGSNGSSGSLTLRKASPLTLRAATMAAPAQSASHPAELDASVQGVSFPYWEEHFGWRSSGARVDQVGGRAVTTVFYTNGNGERIGYAIAAGSAPSVAGGVVNWRDGTPYRLLDENGAPVVTWTRDGHLCVVSGRGVNSAMLLKLASASDDVAS